MRMIKNDSLLENHAAALIVVMLKKAGSFSFALGKKASPTLGGGLTADERYEGGAASRVARGNVKIEQQVYLYVLLVCGVSVAFASFMTRPTWAKRTRACVCFFHFLPAFQISVLKLSLPSRAGAGIAEGPFASGRNALIHRNLCRSSSYSVYLQSSCGTATTL